MKRLAGDPNRRPFDPTSKLGSRAASHAKRGKPWDRPQGHVRFCFRNEETDELEECVVLPLPSEKETREWLARAEKPRWDRGATGVRTLVKGQLSAPAPRPSPGPRSA